MLYGPFYNLAFRGLGRMPTISYDVSGIPNAGIPLMDTRNGLIRKSNVLIFVMFHMWLGRWGVLGFATARRYFSYI